MSKKGTTQETTPLALQESESGLKHFMLDLETCGTRPGCVVLSVGLVHFSVRPRAILSSFYTVVDFQDSRDYGLRVEEATMTWWAAQSTAERHVLDEARSGKGLMVLDAFDRIADYVRYSVPDSASRRVWANGANFDFGILREMARAAGVADRLFPWSFRQERCHRTLCALTPEVKIENAVRGNALVKHNAMDDAVAQALHLMNVAEKLGVVLR
jgi:hypothetical protein